MTDTASELIGDGLNDLSAHLDGMSEAIAPLDLEALVLARAQLEEVKSRVNGAISAVDLRLCDLIPIGATETLPGVGQVVITSNGRQSTNGVKLAAVLAARVADAPANADGEPLPPAELCAKTAAELVDAFALDTPSTRVRSGALKARGLKPGAFVDYSDGEPKVRFISAGEAFG